MAKQIVRYRYLTIPNKLYADVRITVDESSHAEIINTYEGGKSTNIVLLPMINIQLVRPVEMSDTGRRFRAAGSQNDSIGLTKYNYPTFIMELKSIYEGMKTPDLYVYRGERLDLNDKVAESIRRVFIIGRTNVEFRPVVIEQSNETGGIDRIEGIKIKFNNEASSTLLTLREVESMLWIMNHTDIDNLVITMYFNLIDRNAYSKERSKPIVDITPTTNKPVYSKASSVYEASPINEIPNASITVEESMPLKPAKQETIVTIPAEKYKLSDVPSDTDELIPFDAVSN